MKNISLLTVGILVFAVACGNKMTANNEAIISTDTVAVVSYEPRQMATDWNNFDRFPTFENEELKFYDVGFYHNEEMDKSVENLHWYGLFEGENGYYLEKTKIKLTQVADYLTDIDGAWEVGVVGKKDSCLFLIEDKPYLSERKIIKLYLPKDLTNIRDINDSIYVNTKFLPTESFSFSYLGIDYQFIATGNKDITNYHLYLKATINGETLTTLLSSIYSFDDRMVEILFAGDIDGDGILDLIIDNSRKYSYVQPTLYLSKPAEKGQIVKPVGWYSHTGC